MDCCCPGASESTPAICRACSTKGSAVDRQTVKALLTETALQRIVHTQYRFCPDRGCDVVYFGDDRSVFMKNDIRVPVWQKEPAGSRMICYCFGENERDIRGEIIQAGESHAVERVRAHIAAGRCACEVRNPKGTCCLGDVTNAVNRIRADAHVAHR